MKFEHTLSPAAVKVFRAGVEKLNELRLEQLRALGLSKEAEMQSAALQQSISTQVAIIEQTEGLPASVRPYQLSIDCTKLIGEVPDAAAAPTAEVLTIKTAGNVGIGTPAGKANGSAAAGVDRA